MLKIGELAPDFELPDADMEVVSLGEYKGRCNVVLYFYPKDDTPGCTMEAIEFSELDERFQKADTVVLGVSMDDCVSHGHFRDKHGLTVRLLADTDGDVCRKYSVLHDKEAEEKHRPMVARSTFVIDKKGALRHVLSSVTPRHHAHDVLQLVKELN